MGKDEEVECLVNAIKKAFPDAANKATKIMDGLGFDDADKAHFLWLEAFADVTNSAMKRMKEEECKSHLEFMSMELAKGNETIINAIDVSYVENLMFKFSDSEKKWSWKLFPRNIKKLYERMWGKPRF